MKAVGLITEYNPLHNGHIHHLNTAKELTGADVTVCVMSGNFVQRGEPAIIDKHSRAKAAIDSGVNLVVELPTYYALSSAEWFATGATLTLDTLNVDSFVFGSECDDVALLSECADIFLKEPADYKASLKTNLTKGNSFPKARHMALSDIYGKDLADVCESPNNILGIEYIKAVKKLGLAIKPQTIKRIEAGYHDNALETNNAVNPHNKTTDRIASATAIRNGITEHINNLSDYMPLSMSEIFDSMTGKKSPVLPEHFSAILNYKISEIMYRCHNNKQDFCKELCRYIDVTQDLANRLFAVHSDGITFTQYAETLKNKQYTLTRINRVLMHIILELTVDLKDKYESANVPYIRVLGMDHKGRKYLNAIKKCIDIPMVIKVADHKDVLREDLHAASVYNQIVNNVYGITPMSEYKKSIYIR